MSSAKICGRGGGEDGNCATSNVDERNCVGGDLSALKNAVALPEMKRDEKQKTNEKLVSSADGFCGSVALCTDNDEGLLKANVQRVFDRMNDCRNFGRVGRNINVVAASRNSLFVEVTLAEEHVNNKGTMHGGFTAAMTDIVTARAVGITVCDVPMVSVEIAISYMNPAQIGDVVTIEAVCLKIGRSMAFAEAIFRRKRDGLLLAKGKHNIAFLNHLRKADTSEPVNQF